VIPPLAEWDSFYVIVGSSAAALTGLMFVVMALIADDTVTAPKSSGTVAAFGTPNIVHFCAALVVSSALSAPWHSLTNVAGAIGVCGAAGLVYALIVLHRARRQTGYKPVLEDWLFHAVFPIAAYSAVVIAAFLLSKDPERSLFAVAAAVLALVLIGIHNAWDTVTYLALRTPDAQSQNKP
jgi:hypothetical protein